MRRGRLIRRYKRFLADVVLDDGTETTVHVANPGAMLGLNHPGLTVWCSDSQSKTRKLPLSWELTEVDGGLVGVNTHHPNRIVAEALAANVIPELTGYGRIRPEVKYGEASRIDFLLENEMSPPLGPGLEPAQSNNTVNRRCWVEVKNCHLSRAVGLAEFPDCVAARSAKHLRELSAMVANGDRAVLLFVVQRMDCDRFATADDIDPVFSQGLRDAIAAGVELLVYRCDMGMDGVRISNRLALAGHGLR